MDVVVPNLSLKRTILFFFCLKEKKRYGVDTVEMLDLRNKHVIENSTAFVPMQPGRIKSRAEQHWQKSQAYQINI